MFSKRVSARKYPRQDPLSYSILLMSNKQRKLVNADKTINHFNPTRGNRNAPDKLVVTKAKLLMLHNNAKEDASSPLMDSRAIKSSNIIKINIPTRLKIIS